ncbi:hypothetical protein RhiirA5_372879 [Rhizophagus irregularis]|uniref:Uncharacterized protein n=1 Tax=Rhizophagus irregularis TaxID=588596 RepID=A0A2N0Q0Y6_9GLOM|nr:hypothetical protein RhiirA5_372879 [Rhizophagus irregularis]
MPKGQLVANDDDDDEYIPSSDYSEDSSDNEYIDKRIKNLDNSFLIWSSNAHNKLKKSYTGNSRATKFKKYGPSGTFTKAAKLSQPITNFFHKSQEASGEFKIGDDYELEDKRNDDKLEDNDEIEDDIDELEEDNNDELDDNDEELEEDNNDELEDDDEELEEDNGDKLEDKYDDDKLKDKDDDNVYNKGTYKAKQIRIWAKCWIEYGTLPKSLQGCHQKIKSIIDDEDVIERSLLFVRKKEGKITPKEYQTYVKEVLFSRLGMEESKKLISIKTSCIWLKKLGLIPQSRKKGIYFDGHEREDVVEYRKEFLDKMLSYEKFMPTFEGENMEQKNLVLLPNKKLHILITHNEYLFYANDDRPVVWAPIGEPPLRKKGQGKSIMVSDFLLETDGRLKLNEDEILLYPEIPVEARKFLRPGKNEEGCTNHEAMAKDALNINNMNVNLEGKQARMRSTFFGLNNTFQSMVFPSNHPIFPNQPKGMKQILIERGLWYDGLIGHCQLCKLKIDDITRTDCCMHKILSLEEDFKSQKSQLQEEIEKRGHICIFYPKYHCKLNYIEMYWGAAKRYTRENCNYTWSSLQKTVPEALDSISLITIRKFARKS